jgi:hypothetical protein
MQYYHRNNIKKIEKFFLYTPQYNYTYSHPPYPPSKTSKDILR